ncbi:hypothetical protein [Streptomyces tsukubensis]|uniref:hypothetical protein n=1 Tax=Streptomyces tsukubensis TaxID=83656 RepID=UPI00344ED27E
MTVHLHVTFTRHRLGTPENRPAGLPGGRQSFAENEVLPQLDELLFSSLESVSVILVEVTDTVVRVAARTASPGGLHYDADSCRLTGRLPGLRGQERGRRRFVRRWPGFARRYGAGRLG